MWDVYVIIDCIDSGYGVYTIYVYDVMMVIRHHSNYRIAQNFDGGKSLTNEAFQKV